MRSAVSRTLSLALLVSCGFVLGGCQAERTIVSPVEPDWSYHDGNEQLSNNDAWEQMIPTTAVLRFDETKVAHVEDPTR